MRFLIFISSLCILLLLGYSAMEKKGFVPDDLSRVIRTIKSNIISPESEEENTELDSKKDTDLMKSNEPLNNMNNSKTGELPIVSDNSSDKKRASSEPHLDKNEIENDDSLSNDDFTDERISLGNKGAQASKENDPEGIHINWSVLEETQNILSSTDEILK